MTQMFKSLKFLKDQNHLKTLPYHHYNYVKITQN